MITVRPLTAADRSAWDQLYAGYAAFYKVAQTPKMREQVWGWLMDSGQSSEALVADLDGTVVGLAHFRPFARPLSASIGGFLDDLFVKPEARGTGAAEALICALQDLGQARGWTVIRWITAEDNYRARGLYDRLADKTKWTTYDIKL